MFYAVNFLHLWTVMFAWVNWLLSHKNSTSPQQGFFLQITFVNTAIWKKEIAVLILQVTDKWLNKKPTWSLLIWLSGQFFLPIGDA